MWQPKLHAFQYRTEQPTVSTSPLHGKMTVRRKGIQGEQHINFYQLRQMWMFAQPDWTERSWEHEIWNCPHQLTTLWIMASQNIQALQIFTQKSVTTLAIPLYASKENNRQKTAVRRHFCRQFCLHAGLLTVRGRLYVFRASNYKSVSGSLPWCSCYQSKRWYNKRRNTVGLSTTTP